MSRSCSSPTTGKIPGEIITDRLLEPSEPASFSVDRGHIIRIVDVDGQQVGDMLPFTAALDDRYSNAHTKLLNGKGMVSTGDVLYSRECRPMFTIRTDTVGQHYLANATCSEARNVVRYGVHDTRSCRKNFMTAAGDSLDPTALGLCFNVFMNVAYTPRGVRINREPTSEPGDYIEFEGLIDTYVLFSNCPSRRNPCNAYNPTSLRVLVYDPDEGTVGTDGITK